MAWKDVTIEDLAKQLGVSLSEVREKQKLVNKIIQARKAKGFSQAALADKLGITQARVAQIESGIGTAKVSFDVLLETLIALGYDFKVVARRVA
jgi:DNA-binding XRE family transcriptional regulator